MKNVKYWEQLQNIFSWNEVYEFVELSSYLVENFRNEKCILVQKWICENIMENSLDIYHKCRLLGLLPKLVSNQNYNEMYDHNIR